MKREKRKIKKVYVDRRHRRVLYRVIHLQNLKKRHKSDLDATLTAATGKGGSALNNVCSKQPR